jgi:Flp pilus assembly protein TadG
MRRLLAAFGADRRAVVAIEFAIIAPVMLLLAGGVFEIGSLLHANAAVNRLAMQYAVSFANCSDTSAGACQTELNQYATTAALGNIAPQLSSALVTLSMAQVTMNGTSPTIEYASPTGLTLSAAQTAALQAAVASGQAGVVVTVTYKYSPLVFTTLMAPYIGSSFTLTYTAAQLK